MPNRLDVLIVVDVEHALISGSLVDCLYVVDTNGYAGSWRDGPSQLHTVCEDGQLLTWSVAAVDPGSDVVIAKFSGQMVDQKLCVPRASEFAGDTQWSGELQARGRFMACSYSVILGLGPKQLSFDADLKVV